MVLNCGDQVLDYLRCFKMDDLVISIVVLYLSKALLPPVLILTAVICVLTPARMFNHWLHISLSGRVLVSETSLSVMQKFNQSASKHQANTNLTETK